jgi:hypothetical protein
MPDASSDSQHGDEVDQLRWEEAAQLRGEHRGWIIIWLSAHSQFRAYRRLPGTRRDTVLSAATGRDLAAQISQAEQAVRLPAQARRDDPRPGDPRPGDPRPGDSRPGDSRPGDPPAG